MEFIIECANTSLSGLLVRNDFTNLLQSVTLLASSDSPESHMSNCLLKLSILCQLRTLGNSFKKYHSTTLSLFDLNLTFLCLNGFFCFSWNGQ